MRYLLPNLRNLRFSYDCRFDEDPGDYALPLRILLSPSLTYSQALSISGPPPSPTLYAADLVPLFDLDLRHFSVYGCGIAVSDGLIRDMSSAWPPRARRTRSEGHIRRNTPRSFAAGIQLPTPAHPRRAGRRDCIPLPAVRHGNPARLWALASVPSRTERRVWTRSGPGLRRRLSRGLLPGMHSSLQCMARLRSRPTLAHLRRLVGSRVVSITVIPDGPCTRERSGSKVSGPANLEVLRCIP
ncbi:hypothetical protein C8Q80DRAFT_394477 [Daedaleopsis nitida]|nr:hypothetical protein C8Q80DRAFT_394477 [Daedaleopsis nitida]